MAKKSKRTHFPMSWRWDVDYLQSLPPKDRAWMEQFLNEWYRSDFSADEPLHTPEQQREIYNSYNQAARDVATATGDTVSSHLATPAAKNCHNRYYCPKDHIMQGDTSLSNEDAIIEAIDSERLSKQN